jgi:hypothetical protein
MENTRLRSHTIKPSSCSLVAAEDQVERVCSAREHGGRADEQRSSVLHRPRASRRGRLLALSSPCRPRFRRSVREGRLADHCSCAEGYSDAVSHSSRINSGASDSAARRTQRGRLRHQAISTKRRASAAGRLSCSRCRRCFILARASATSGAAILTCFRVPEPRLAAVSRVHQDGGALRAQCPAPQASRPCPYRPIIHVVRRGFSRADRTLVPVQHRPPQIFPVYFFTLIIYIFSHLPANAEPRAQAAADDAGSAGTSLLHQRDTGPCRPARRAWLEHAHQL